MLLLKPLVFLFTGVLPFLLQFTVSAQAPKLEVALRLDPSPPAYIAFWPKHSGLAEIRVNNTGTEMTTRLTARFLNSQNAVIAEIPGAHAPMIQLNAGTTVINAAKEINKEFIQLTTAFEQEINATGKLSPGNVRR